MDGSFSYIEGLGERLGGRRRNDADNVAKFLASAGFKIKKVEHGDPQFEDDTVYLRDGRHVQVGEDYFVVVSVDEKMENYRLVDVEGCNLADLLVTLKSATER